MNLVDCIVFDFYPTCLYTSLNIFLSETNIKDVLQAISETYSARMMCYRQIKFIKTDGDSCANLEKTVTKWLDIPCNLVQTHLIFTKIELSYVYVIVDEWSDNVSYDL